MKLRLTISLPCYKRPERTKRSIECILAQDIDGWEAFINGDGCSDFQQLIDSGYLEDTAKRAAERGNIIHYMNFPQNSGGYGYALTNFAIQNASGKYIIFYANDDIIFPNHFRNYLEIENYPELDFMYFNSWVDCVKSIRDSSLNFTHVGHSEIIVKTELAKTITPHSTEYGHDWNFVKEVIEKGKGQKSQYNECTYKVMHVPGIGTNDVID
jgi:glycosyltransferase involved in cell wall biosynthesis